MSSWVLEYPLWGLQNPGLTPGYENGARTCGGLIYQPTWVEWERSEKTDVVRENAGDLLVRERLGEEVDVFPPPCFVQVGELESGPDLRDENEPTRNALAFVTALRLHNTGQFFDFTQSGIYGETDRGFVSRSVTPFRSAFYRYPWSDRYQLRLDELEAVENLFHAVLTAAEPRFDVAMENMRVSYGISVPHAEVALLRFMSLETLLGGLFSSVAGVRSSGRAARAVKSGDWVEEWLEGPGFRLRGWVAHGVDSHEIVDETDLGRLERIVRDLAVAYIDFVGGADRGDDPFASFNRSLAGA